MFSIIVCSINNTYLDALKINISETIGCPYELLVWDNHLSPRPISEVYNILGKQAKYPRICFIHEDIIFQTQNWSSVLLTAFQEEPELGMIGVAGAKYKSRTPSGWSTGIASLDCMHILHRNTNGEIKQLQSGSPHSMREPVVNVDGVFICIRKEVLETAQFNEKLLKGFHLYDIDFSHRVVPKYKAAVSFGFDIIHLTEGGNYGDSWVEYTLRWHKLYAAQLPVTLNGSGASRAVERKIRRYWLRRLSTEKISWKNKIRWLMASRAYADPSSWPNAGLFLFRRPLY